MNIWEKMMTALRGGVNEAGEAFVDSQALLILDQEVREATEELKQSKESLAGVMARQKVAEEKATQLKQRISEYEGYATQALDKGDDALAMEVAQKIADLEAQYVNESQLAKDYERSASELKSAIKLADQNIKRLKQQVDTVKATENVQRAQAAVAERHSGGNSKLRTAMESLDRIKEKQQLKSAQMQAASELARENKVDSLEEKLRQAGITSAGNSAQEVLDRLKTR